MDRHAANACVSSSNSIAEHDKNPFKEKLASVHGIVRQKTTLRQKLACTLTCRQCALELKFQF